VTAQSAHSTQSTGTRARVSVVMMTRDRREQVMTSLARLLALPERPPVILVDNASTDGTVDAVRNRFPQVTVIALDRNLGSAARNAGVRAATTPYVAFSDDDSWWAPGALTRAAAHFDGAPRLAVLAGRTLVGPQEREDPLNAVLAVSPLGRPAGLPGPAVLGFIACAAVVRREAFLAAGGFHPVIFFLGEEAVLAQDLAAAGWQLAYTDDVLAHHHPIPGPERGGRRELQLRNALLSAWLRRPWPVVARETLRIARQLPDPAAAGALLQTGRRLPMALRHRRRLPDPVEQQLRLLERPEPPTARPSGRRPRAEGREPFEMHGR
jgi:GT2 family glycosyltransferase